MDTLVQQTESPFTAEVLHFPLPAKFRMPQVEAFDGVKDPVDHLNTYKNQMELHGYQDPVRCRAFAITLKGPALAWFNRLPPSSISSFWELSIASVSHFIGARTYRKPSYHLLMIKQGSQESLRSYVQRFNAESLKVDIPDEKFTITAFIAGLVVQSKDLMFSISKNPQESMAEVLAKAEKYINGEEGLISKKESSSTHKEKRGIDKRRGRLAFDKKFIGSYLTTEVQLTSSSRQPSIRWASEGRNWNRQHTSTGVFWGKGITFGFDTASAHPRRAPLPGGDDRKIPHYRRLICL